jgi:hypothetical protein
MDKYKNEVLLFAALGFGGLFSLDSALATSPARKIQLPAQQLDLRAPSHALDISDKTSASFPSMVHRQPSSSQEQPRLALLGSDGVRPRRSIQEFARQVRREGLPVARLFETKSALLHLGLNPKGKPGLWLVQKTR